MNHTPTEQGRLEQGHTLTSIHLNLAPSRLQKDQDSNLSTISQVINFLIIFNLEKKMASEKSSPGMVKAREKRKSDRERLEETLGKANSRPVGKH